MVHSGAGAVVSHLWHFYSSHPSHPSSPAVQVWGVTLYDDVRRGSGVATGHPAAAARPGLHTAIKLHCVFTMWVLPSLFII